MKDGLADDGLADLRYSGNMERLKGRNSTTQKETQARNISHFSLMGMEIVRLAQLE